MPSIGTSGTSGQRKGRGMSGSVRRMISTAAQTMTKASSVPMLTRSRKHAQRQQRRHQADNHAGDDRRLPRRARTSGARRRKIWLGNSPSRAMASMIRGWLNMMHHQHGGDAGQSAERDDRIEPTASPT